MANCRFHGSMKGCKNSFNCSFSHSNPNSVPKCLYDKNQCPYRYNCIFRHDTFPNTQNVNKSITIFGLSPDVKESTLFELFNAIAPIQYIFILRNRETRKSLGCALIRFYTHLDAQRVFEGMNFITIKSKPIRIVFGKFYNEMDHDGFKKANNVFISNMHESIDDKTLDDVFSFFGDVVSCKVFHDKAGYNFGFVCYSHPKAGKKSTKLLNGQIVSERRLYSEVLQLKISKDDKKNDIVKRDKKLIPLDLYMECLQELFEDNNECIKTIKLISNVEKIWINMNDLYAKDLNKSKILINAFLNNIEVNNDSNIPIIPLEIINLLLLFYYINDDNIMEIMVIGSEINIQKAMCLIEINIINEIQKHLYYLCS